jgi:hypothetical protein
MWRYMNMRLDLFVKLLAGYIKKYSTEAFRICTSFRTLKRPFGIISGRPTKHPTNDAFAKRLALLEKGLIKDKWP